MDLPVKHISCNPGIRGICRYCPDIAYSAEHKELRLSLFLPWELPQDHRMPLIVFVQGSAWTCPDVNAQVPQLAEFARRGYAVATVIHRNSLEGHAFPAFLQDAKTAVRYLRAHADEYGIDPDRVIAWGTSSGGNTALLLGLTGSRQEYRTEEYTEQRDDVQLVVSCFPPTDMETLLNDAAKDALYDPDSTYDDDFIAIFRGLVGDRDPRDVLQEMSPTNQVDSCSCIPPTMLLHGSADTLVPYSQSVMMFERLTAAGADAEMVCINGAPHEGTFWSSEVLETIYDFIRRHIPA